MQTCRAVERKQFVLTGTDRFHQNTGSSTKPDVRNRMPLAKYEQTHVYRRESDKVLLKRTYPVRFCPTDKKLFFGQSDQFTG